MLKVTVLLIAEEVVMILGPANTWVCLDPLHEVLQLIEVLIVECRLLSQTRVIILVAEDDVIAA